MHENVADRKGTKRIPYIIKLLRSNILNLAYPTIPCN